MTWIPSHHHTTLYLSGLPVDETAFDGQFFILLVQGEGEDVK